MPRSFVVVNPTAGQRRSRLDRERLEQALTDAGLSAHIYATKAPGDATQAVREACDQGFERIIVAAGDGTVHEAVAGMVGADASLGLVPLGTGNVLARELGLPLRLGEAVGVLAEGHERSMDVGRSGEDYFLVMAGVGADAEMVHRVNPTLKRVLGQGAFYWAVLTRIPVEQPRAMTVQVDDEVREGRFWLVAIASGAEYAPHISFTPDGVMGDGLLDVALLSGNRWDLLSTLAGALAGRRAMRNVEVLRGLRVRVECEEPTYYHLDGDVIAAATEVEFELIPQALRVIVPPQEPV